MSACDFVTLRNGPTVPLAPLRLLWALEDRGLRFRLDGEDIIITPKGSLTDADRTQLKQWKPHVRALISYCDSGRADALQ